MHIVEKQQTRVHTQTTDKNLFSQSLYTNIYIHSLCCLLHVSDLCGGAVMAVGDPHCHVVVGASSCIKPAGDGDGSCIPLDVKVLFFITT